MRSATGITATLSLMLASAALALAGPATASSVADGANAAAGAANAAERSTHQRIVDYWTPERRASALPREMTLPSTRAKGGKPGPPGGGGGDTTTTVTGAVWTDKTAPVARTTGKVYFTMGGTNYVCSGSAVAGSVNLVLTAGHCVWDDADGFASYFLFWPGYDNGTKPYGTWSATSLFTTADWHATGGHDWPDDAGLAVVTDGVGGTLSQSLGTLPAMAGSSGSNLDGQTYSAFGYPAAQKYKGQTLIYCQGPVVTGWDGNPDTMSMACDMTGGSSGGPWFSAAGGTGEIVSVNSYGYRGVTRMFGPTFDGAESTMSSAAADGTCGEGEVCTADVTSP